ncbi:hypothetical protein ACFQDD_00880 [Halorubrum pallidum]|uniref:ArsR family transcriptional regulator n=1 Tax=Halorubrum pallidum TaxID=1526114 RepID=A0ABD5T015_9EURY|nr:hypothetical protein [Halorubrum sp. LN27]
MRRSGLSTDEIAEFLRSKGAIEALLAIGTDGGRWSDIEEQVDISTATLTERLGDARDLGLVKSNTMDHESSVSKIYQLDTLGQTVYHQMHLSNIVSTWTYLKKTREEFESQREDVIEWVESDDFEDTYEARMKRDQEESRPGGPNHTDNENF